MFVKLSQPKKFWHYSTSDHTDLTLTIYEPDGTALTPIVTTAVSAVVNYLRITAAYTFTTTGTYRLKWTATGYTDWEECIVTTTPPADEHPGVSRKYVVEGASWAAPRLYVLDSDLAAEEDCAFTALAASVTSSKAVATFTIPAGASITVAFDSTSPTYTVSLTAGVQTLLFVLDEINSAIRYGRALTSAGSIRIESDYEGEATQVVLGGHAATLTELGLTAGTYTATFDDPPITLTAVDSTLAYETSKFVQLDEGNYLFLWTDGTTVQLAEDVFVYSDHTYADCTFEVVESTTSDALTGVEVVVMSTAGVTLRRGFTGVDGIFSTSLEPGTYIATVRRDRCVFGINNFTINVQDRHSTLATNDFSLSTNFTRPNFSDAPIVGQTSFSTMKAQFIDMQGRPLAGIRVLVSHNYVPYQVTSVAGTAVAVSGHPLTLFTDGMGAIEEPLIRGVTVEVSVEGTSIRRYLTVPALSEFNLLDYFTQDDLFDIVRLQAPAAVQVDI